MLHRFATFEEAALFVSRKRSEGYYAEILHEHVSVLWGPLAMGGVAAWVSEEKLEDEDEASVPDVKVPRLPQELSMTVAPVVLSLLAILLVYGAVMLAKDFSHYPYLTGNKVLRFLFDMGLASLLVVLSAWVGSKWAHAFWDRSHRFHQHAALMHAVIGLVLLFLVTELGNWVLFTLLEFVLF